MEKLTPEELEKLTFEDLLKLEPEELRRVLRERALNSERIKLPPPDHPIFQEGWTIFTLPRFGRSKSDSHENPPSGSEDEK